MRMVHRERARGARLREGLLVEAGLENRLHTFVGEGPQGLGPLTGGFESRVAILPAQAQHAQTGPVALFGMRAAVQDGGHDGRRRGAHGLGPVDQPGGRPVPIALVGQGQVRDHGGVAPLLSAADMARHPLAVVEALEGRGGEAHLELGADQGRRHAVVMPLHLEVPVNVDSGLSPLGIDIGFGGERLQRGPVHDVEDRSTAAGEFLEGAGVQPRQARGDRSIEVGETEEGLMAQAGQNPPLDDLHADLNLGFVAWFPDSGRNDGHAIVLGQRLIRGVELRLIPASLGDPAFEIVGDHDLGHATEEGEGPDMRGRPVRQRLCPGRLGIGIVGGPQHGDEDLRLAERPGVPGAHRHGLPRIIDEQLLARPMLLAQTPIQGLEPDAIPVAEAAVLVAVGMLVLILLPQQGEGDPLAG